MNFTSTKNIMFSTKKQMRTFATLITVLSCLIHSHLLGQVQTISGTVFDHSDGVELVGAIVLIKGTTNGTVTDLDGNYTLQDVNASDTLLVSYLGFLPYEEVIGNRSIINIKLKPSINTLEEVVVIGYGTSTRAELTESVGTLKSDDITRTGALTLESALQGRVSGVKVVSSDGEPGAGLSVQIRGSSSINGSSEPLYVIDGVPIRKEDFAGDQDGEGNLLDPGSFDPLAGINPNDIQSMEVLKDASATAIYGSRGSNGVVIITTKSGKSGDVRVTYSPRFSVSSIANKLDLMNASEFYQYSYNVNPNSGLFTNPENVGFTDAEPPLFEGAEGTDWQDLLFRTAYIQQHNLSLRGGAENVTFSTSLGYTDQQGIVVESNLKRYTALTKVNVKGRKIKLTTNLNVSRTEREGSFYNANDDTNAGAGVVTKIFGARPIVDPDRVTDPFFDEDDNEDENDFFSNPYLLATTAINETEQTRLTGNIRTTYKISSNLSFENRLGGNLVSSSNSQYFPDQTTRQGRNRGGFARLVENNKFRTLQEYFLRYDLKKRRHHFRFVLGHTREYQRNEPLRVTSEGFDVDDLTVNDISLGARVLRPSNTQITEEKLISYVGRANYDYQKKYFLTVTGRYDQSSKFLDDNVSSFFPSAALAWVVSKEGFLKDSRNVAFLKLRLSHGITGNQGVGAFASRQLIGTNTYNFNGIQVTGLQLNQINNPDLRWEQNAQSNIGIDLDVFEGKVSITADVFNKVTSDALLALPISAANGLNNDPRQNIGKIRNRGVELGITLQTLSKKDFSWVTNFNISHIRNKILDLGEISEFFVSYNGAAEMINSMIYREGGEIGEFYGYQLDGIFLNEEEVAASNQLNAQVGGYKIKDINGPLGTPDGVIDELDRTVLGSIQPDYFGGITNSFSYKGFDLSVFLEFSVGREVYNGNSFHLLNTLNARNKLTSVLDDASIIETVQVLDDQDQPTGATELAVTREGRLAAFGVPDLNLPNELFVEDGSFLRVQNITLGYNLKNPEKIGLRNFRVFVSATNVALFTNYTGYDPDVNITRQNGLARGFDFGTYPRARNFSTGLNITF